MIWSAGALVGEMIEQVGARIRRVIDWAVAAAGDVALSTHSHGLRVLTACGLDLPPRAGRLFAPGTASLSVLGNEHETRATRSWNQRGA